MGRPREHGTATRAALLTTATALLSSEGVDAVTVRRVAAETGTTTRAVYSLFGDKDGLLRALFGEIAETMRRYHLAVPEREDPVAELAELASAYRAAAREHPDLYPLYIGRAAYSLRPTAADIAHSFTSFERVEDAVRRAVKSGRFPGRAPEAIVVQLWSLVHGLASIELSGFLGDEDQAAARWRDAVSAALTGYQQAP
ncbi:MAG TPA: TetR/AcrR family transcriptional regulator [Streptosporangiaceae bacterium]|nr:TetR/AcrR family transcriptional regulator [Streptosporangiaceae bacterium]